MVAFSRFVAAGVALAGLCVAAPAAALTLTFQVTVGGYTPGAPPIDDFQMTWTFEPTYSAPASTYYGEVAGVVETPQNAAMFALAGLEPPIQRPEMIIDSYALIRTGFGTEKLVQFNQRFQQFDEATLRYSDYQNQINAGSVGATVGYTPGGFVHFVQSRGELAWHQTAFEYAGDVPGGPLARVVDYRIYTGTARLIAWDVEPEAPPVEPEIPPVPVPEPGTWALMILGFGLAGAALRRRKVLAAA